MTESTLSPELQAANERLLALRAKRQADKEAQGISRPVVVAPSVETEEWVRPGMVEQLPSHLGWGSEAVTAVMRAAKQRQMEPNTGPRPISPLLVKVSSLDASEPDEPDEPEPAEVDGVLQIYPNLAFAILKHQLVAPARVWHLLRYMDSSGRGWVTVEEARAELTDPNSPFHVCSWRQLRNLLAKGNPIFWSYNGKRIWLRSFTRVACALDVDRVRNHPVELRLSVFLGGIGDLRAHLYASFHAGRDRDTVHENGTIEPGYPTSRATLEEISGVKRRSQQNYEARAEVQVTHNYAIGEFATDINREKRTYDKRTASFIFVDKQGRIGRPGAEYMAWQMPNSYAAPHPQRACGRKQRRINNRLKVLCDDKPAGNVQPWDIVRYYGNGKRAVKSYNRNPDRDCYYPLPKRISRRGRIKKIWGVIMHLE